MRARHSLHHMAPDRTAKADAEAISLRSHSSNSSGHTNASGQATPASESASNPDPDLDLDSFDREGIAAQRQRRAHGYSQHPPRPLSRPSASRASGASSAADSNDDDDDDDGSEIYELKEFRGHAIRMRDEDRDEDEDEDEDEGYSEDDEEARGNRERAGTRLSDGTVASSGSRPQFYTAKEENAVIRKLDRRLVMFLAFCYMLSFVDRSNIGNARIAGMETDLQSTPPREDYFAWALRAFYFAYIFFEWMTLLWRVVPAHIYVSLIVLSWGVVASLQAVVTSYPLLIALRVLLGIGEAGFAGVPFYLSFFFKRRELAFRTALFISAAPLASAFAGFVAWLILWVGESLPIASWRLLFLVEGFPSIVVATIAWGVIPDSPETTPYLSPRERKIALLRLQHEKADQHSHRRSSFSSPSTRKNKPASSTSGLRSKDVLAAFTDPKAWLTAFMLFLANMAYSTLPAFLPTILKDMGHTELQAEALSAPPNLLAFGIVLITAHVSDRAQSRSPFIAAHALLSASGYLVLALARPAGDELMSPAIRYLAVYPAAVGFFSVVVLVLAWSVNNQPTEGRRGGGFALLQVVGQCGPLLGAQLYPDRDAPFFETGMWACAAAMAGIAVLALILRAYLVRLNRKLDKEEREGEGVEEEIQRLVGSERKERMGFRYIL
ncbi:major facilitator superfamily domain-containing protein [Xylaria cf. heliscus]|nr:major facilitator superfamily domain-containing protein [Xylaria cf. heliscus]